MALLVAGPDSGLRQQLRQYLTCRAWARRKAVLAGFDWGGRTACIGAALWPERVRALVSVSGYLIGNQEAGKMPLPPKAEFEWWYQCCCANRSPPLFRRSQFPDLIACFATDIDAGLARSAVSGTTMRRRDFITGIAGSAVAWSGAARAQTLEAVPYSAGTAKPRLSAPLNACDCHMHHYGTRYPAISGALRPHPDATVADYRLLQKRIGTTRVVVVTPSLYGTDNSATLDAMAEFGPSARGVAVVNTGVADEELKRLAGLGIRGIRFNLATPGTTTIDMVEPLSKRVHELGWHVQFHMRPEQIVESEVLFGRLPSPIVFDHMGRIPRSVGVEHPAYKVMRGLLDKGRTWVKLSGAYMDIKAGDTRAGPPTYTDSVALAQAFLKTAPERMVWGSDWPHPTEQDKPDDAVLFDLLAAIAPEEPLRTRILVANPAQLYDFPKAG